MIKDKNFLTTGEVAELLSVTAVTIRRKVDAGKIPALRVPGSTHRRIPADWVRAKLEEAIK